MISTSSILKLDYDNISFSTIRKKFQSLSYVNSKFIKAERIECYKTNKGYHVYIYSKRNLDKIDVIFLQALLGSDVNREFFNYCRLKINGLSIDWNVLFKEKRKRMDGVLTLVSKEKPLHKYSYMLMRALSKK